MLLNDRLKNAKINSLNSKVLFHTVEHLFSNQTYEDKCRN